MRVIFNTISFTPMQRLPVLNGIALPKITENCHSNANIKRLSINLPLSYTKRYFTYMKSYLDWELSDINPVKHQWEKGWTADGKPYCLMENWVESNYGRTLLYHTKLSSVHFELKAASSDMVFLKKGTRSIFKLSTNEE